LCQVLEGYKTDEQVRAAAEGAQRMFDAQMRQLQRPLDAHIQVWAHDGRRIYVSLDLPEHRPLGLASATSFDWHGRNYSVTSVTSSRYQIDVLDSITVLSEREVVMEVLGDLLLKMLIAFPLFLLPTWFAVHSGLKPLGALSKTLRQRPADDLTPFYSDMRYEELRPVVHALNELMGRLRHKIKQEQAFVHDAAHELQTPLAVIANQTHVLAAATSSEERAEAQQNAENAIERAGHLVRQMVALARLDSDRQDNLKTLDVAAEVRELLAPLVSGALARGIELTLDSPDSVALYGDKVALHSIVTNLVDNALRYIGG
jgi:signal transduction histidine kinase